MLASHHHRHASSPQSLLQRTGFSLVELLMVVVIILILMGLLLVGVNSGLSRARVVSAATEISNLDKAIKDFKLQFGVEPPSFIILYEDPAQWAANPPTEPAAITDDAQRTQLRNISRATIRSMWPNYSFTTAVDIDDDGAFTSAFILNGAECLVFFLGGICDRVDLDGDGVADFAPSGFSANPEVPFSRGGNRVGPFFSFDPARLVDNFSRPNPQNGLPEYLDNLPGQVTPIQYFSSYDGAGYRPRGRNGIAGDADDEAIPGGLISHYIMANGAAAGNPPVPPSPQVSWNPGSYQIISPGFDGEFGLGGIYTKENRLPNVAVNYGAGLDRNVAVERDNITNFRGGRLE